MAEFLLYDGQVKLDFDETKHVYKYNGSIVPSVTGIVGVINKPALMGWALKMAGEYLEKNWRPGYSYDELAIEEHIKACKNAHRQKAGEAASIGTIVHKFAENFFKLNGQHPGLPVNEDARRGAQAFLSWVEQCNVEPIASEFKVFHPTYLYAGTCDLDAMIDGRRAIVDLKTSSGVYPEMWLQTVAYQEAREHELGDQVQYDERWILRLDKKTGHFEAKRRDDSFAGKDWAAFRGCLKIYNFLQEFKK